MKTAETIGVRYTKLRAALIQERASWIPAWKDLSDYLMPRHGRFDYDKSNDGRKRYDKILDSTGTFASRTLSSGLMSGVTSPARPWFKLNLPSGNEITLAKRAYLDECENRMRSVMARSNLYNVLPNVYTGIGVFGTGCMAVLEDEQTVIRCTPFQIGTYCLATDHNQRVDTFVRDFRMTARQIVKQFGDAASTSVKSMADGSGSETWVDVVQIIAPNADYDSKKFVSKFKRYHSCYYELGLGGTQLLGESGFDEFPIMAPRWDTNGEDVYGEGPGSVALGDVKMLQKEQTLKLKAIETETDPPLMAPTSLRNSQVTTLPGGMTFYDDRSQNGQGIKRVYESRFSVLEVRGDIAEVQSRINRSFFVDLFMMIAQDDRSGVTATEIMQRQEEKMLMLGPVLNRLDAELLDPVIERIFNIMNRRGLLPEPPPEMRGVELDIEYVSILARAQKMQEVTQVDRWLGTIGNMAQSDPTVIDSVDRDATVTFYAEALGVPAKLQNSDEKKAEIREARSQAAAQEQATAQGLQVAQGAKLLSETNTTDQNALTALLGQG